MHAAGHCFKEMAAVTAYSGSRRRWRYQARKRRWLQTYIRRKTNVRLELGGFHGLGNSAQFACEPLPADSVRAHLRDEFFKSPSKGDIRFRFSGIGHWP